MVVVASSIGVGISGGPAFALWNASIFSIGSKWPIVLCIHVGHAILAPVCPRPAPPCCHSHGTHPEHSPWHRVVVESSHGILYVQAGMGRQMRRCPPPNITPRPWPSCTLFQTDVPFPNPSALLWVLQPSARRQRHRFALNFHFDSCVRFEGVNSRS